MMHDGVHSLLAGLIRISLSPNLGHSRIPFIVQSTSRKRGGPSPSIEGAVLVPPLEVEQTQMRAVVKTAAMQLRSG